MSKVLIIASSISENAAGNVFRNYISKIREKFEVDIISNDFYSDIDADLVILKKQKKIFKRLSLAFLGYDFSDFRMAEIYFSQISCLNYKYVISMFSAHQFFPLYLAYFFKKNNPQTIWLSYCVDALPAPIGWGEPQYYRFGVKKMVNRFISKSDFIYFSNDKMVEYEKNIFNFLDDKVIKSLYAYSNLKFKEYISPNVVFNFVYTGTVYKARKVERFLKAFEKLSFIYPQVRCIFVGTKKKSINLSCLKKETLKKIKFLPFTSKLDDIYSNANILVDIDADIKNDVFMSSKFFNYISTNKPIFSISNIDSPTRNFINDLGLEGVYMSKNDVDEIFLILKQILEINEIIDYRSRYKKVLHFLKKNSWENLFSILENK